MAENPRNLTAEQLMKAYREAVVYTALSNNGADEKCLATEKIYEREINRRFRCFDWMFELGERKSSCL